MHSEDMPSPSPSEDEGYRLLEAALLEYVERYGLTEKARIALKFGRDATTDETRRDQG